MGIFSWLARKNVAIQSRKGLQRQYYEMRGEVGGQKMLNRCLDTASASGYIFGYVTQMIRMQGIGRRNAAKAMNAAFVEVFEEREAARLHERITHYGRGETRIEFDAFADFGEDDAETFILQGEESDVLKDIIRTRLQNLTK
jgi:hypothetical protein